MKNKSILSLLLATLILTGCNQKTHTHVDTDNNHFCDSCNEKLSDHSDNDSDGACDLCGWFVPIEEDFADWPTKNIQDLVLQVSGSTVVIPSFDYADKIEIDTTNLITENVFAIYCYTNNSLCEAEYKRILESNEFEVSETKEDNFYQAYDKNWEIWINFEYNAEFSDLEIYVTISNKMKWPTDKVAEAVQLVKPGTKTIIPSFEASIYWLNYNSTYNVLAINSIGYKDTIIQDYKTILSNNGWDVFYDETFGQWNAISPAEDLIIQIYVEEDKGYFNVDVQTYTKPVFGWPYAEIASLVSDEVKATGEVMPFTGTNSGFEINLKAFPPAIYIFCDKSAQESNKNAYNQALLDNGYSYVGDLYGDPLYCYPGTTLAYRAVVLLDILQIELFNYNEIEGYITCK